MDGSLSYLKGVLLLISKTPKSGVSGHLSYVNEVPEAINTSFIKPQGKLMDTSDGKRVVH